jgi:hypothetical protein
MTFPTNRKYLNLKLPDKGRPPFRTHPLPAERIKDSSPTDRQIHWMTLINHHGPQSPLYLHESDWQTHKSYDGTKDAIYKLWCGGYVFRPEDQIATIKADRNYYVYDLTPQGVEYLKANGLWLEPYREKADWRHDYGLSACTTSIRILAERDGLDVTLAPEWVDPTKRFFPAPFYWGNEIQETMLKPDDVLIVNYKPNPCIYFIEFDRGTEKHEPNTWKRKSTKRTLLQYDYLIGQGVYKQLYNTQFQAKLLFITISGERGNFLLTKSKKWLREPDWLCVNIVDGFDKFFKPPTSLFTHLYEGEYFRPGFPPWYIKKTA